MKTDIELLEMLSKARLKQENNELKLNQEELIVIFNQIPHERKCGLIAALFSQFRHGHPQSVIDGNNQVEIMNACLAEKVDIVHNRPLLILLLTKALGMQARLLTTERSMSVEILNPAINKWEEFDTHGQCALYYQYVQKVKQQEQASAEAKKYARTLHMAAGDIYNFFSYLPAEMREKIILEARNKAVLTENETKKVIDKSLETPPSSSNENKPSQP